MKHSLYILALAATAYVFSSCSGIRSGAGGASTGSYINDNHHSVNPLDLIPVGDRITYTIDISTPEGRQKLHGIKLADAKQLAETEASRKYNCDRLIDPRFDYLMRGKRILRITVDGRPGNFKTQNNQYDSRTRQEIDINVRR